MSFPCATKPFYCLPFRVYVYKHYSASYFIDHHHHTCRTYYCYRINSWTSWRKANRSRPPRKKTNASSVLMQGPQCRRHRAAIVSSVGDASSRQFRARLLSDCCRCVASFAGIYSDILFLFVLIYCCFGVQTFGENFCFGNEKIGPFYL